MSSSNGSLLLAKRLASLSVEKGACSFSEFVSAVRLDAGNNLWNEIKHHLHRAWNEICAENESLPRIFETDALSIIEGISTVSPGSNKNPFRLNYKQKRWLTVGIFLVMMSGIFPPYMGEYQRYMGDHKFSPRSTRFIGYHFMFRPPSADHITRSQMAWGHRAFVSVPHFWIQIATIGLTTIGLIILSSGDCTKPTKHKKTKGKKPCPTPPAPPPTVPEPPPKPEPKPKEKRTPLTSRMF